MPTFVLIPLKIAAKANERERENKSTVGARSSQVILHPGTVRSGVAGDESTLASRLVCCQNFFMAGNYGSNRPVDRMMLVTRKSREMKRESTAACLCMYMLCVLEVLYGIGCSIVSPKVIFALVMCLEGVGLLQSVNDRRAASMDG